MEFLRGIGKFIGSMVFTFFLVLAIVNMGVISFTSYETIESLAGSMFGQQLSSAFTEESIEQLHAVLVFQCSNVDEITVPFEGIELNIDCNDVRDSDKSQLPELVTAGLVNNLYYKKFDCNFVDCITQGNPENLLILISNEGNQFYRSMQIYLWIGAIAGLAIMLVSIKTWSGRLKGLGMALVFTSLPFLVINYLRGYFLPSMPPAVESAVMPVINQLFSSIMSKFIIVLVIGIVLLAGGYGLGFYLSRKAKTTKRK